MDGAGLGTVAPILCSNGYDFESTPGPCHKEPANLCAVTVNGMHRSPLRSGCSRKHGAAGPEQRGGVSVVSVNREITQEWKHCDNRRKTLTFVLSHRT